MDSILPLITFMKTGRYFMVVLLVLSVNLGAFGLLNLFRAQPIMQKTGSLLFSLLTVVFVAGFFWICWFHYQIYLHLPLELPANAVSWLNQQLGFMNQKSAYGLPLYDLHNPPRYIIPVWIENEKYYFWFMCYAVMALIAHFRMKNHRLRGVLHLLLAVQVAVLYFVTDPFGKPLPRFLTEVTPWFAGGQPLMARIGLFMRLYPRMIFYYNAEYMWLHPPLLFLAYGSITLTFVTSMFMLWRREFAIEKMGYDYAKFGYLMLTVGMLLGYPWALKAWGPNWWWDPKICSSIMMWAVFSTYLHTRLYANKPAMWYFSSILGILCFVAMIFTFLASFFFPGEHTFQ